MNLRRGVSLFALVLLAVMTLEACRRPVPPPAPPPAPPPPVVQAPPPPPPPPPPPVQPPPPAPRALTEDEIFAKKTVAELNAEGHLGTVLFDYDESAIRDDQRGILQKNVDWMRRWTSTRVTIEGHADSRGTNQYNLALGERRAAAVRDFMVGQGIAGDRLVTVSRGEESPLCTDETEGCWQRNRRGAPIITAK